MSGDRPPKSRVIMQSGKWLVPPNERPSNWQSILPDPTFLDQVVEATEEKAVQMSRKEAVRAWAEDVRAAGKEYGDPGGSITECGIVLGAGIWCRLPAFIADATGLAFGRVMEIQRRIAMHPLWFDKGVFLGIEEDSEMPDLQFWMICMALNGEMQMRWAGTTFEFLANSRKWAQAS